MQDRSNALVNVSEGARNILNLVKPQVTTNRADDSDNARADALINQLLASGKDDHQALIDSILHRSAIEFAPTRAAEIGSGGYNSSVTKQLQDEAQARATAESTGAVLQAQTEADRTAANLQSSKLQANRTQTVQPPTSTGALIKTIAASVGLNKAFQYGLNKATGYKIGNPFNTPPQVASSGSPGDSDIFGYDKGYGGGDTASGAAGNIGEAGGLGSSVGAGEDSLVAGTSYGDFGGISAAEFSDIVDGTTATALGNSATYSAVTDASAPALLDVAPDAYGDYGSLLGGFAADTGAGATVTSTGVGASALGGGSGVVGGGAGFGAEAGSTAGTGAATELAASDVLSSASSASAVGSGAAGAETGGAIAAEGAASGAAAGEGAAVGAGAGASIAGGAAVAVPAVVSGEVIGQVGGDFLETAFGGEKAGMFGDLGDFFGDIGGGIGDFFGF